MQRWRELRGSIIAAETITSEIWRNGGTSVAPKQPAFGVFNPADVTANHVLKLALRIFPRQLIQGNHSANKVHSVASISPTHTGNLELAAPAWCAFAQSAKFGTTQAGSDKALANPRCLATHITRLYVHIATCAKVTSISLLSAADSSQSPWTVLQIIRKADRICRWLPMDFDPRAYNDMFAPTIQKPLQNQSYLMDSDTRRSGNGNLRWMTGSWLP